jgi:hypothetical protein
MSYCFRVILPPGTEVHTVSCSVPLDANMYSVEPIILETALISAEGDIIYKPELGYDNICYFSNDEEIIAELIRLATFTARATHRVIAQLRKRNTIRRAHLSGLLSDIKGRPPMGQWDLGGIEYQEGIADWTRRLEIPIN